MIKYTSESTHFRMSTQHHSFEFPTGAERSDKGWYYQLIRVKNHEEEVQKSEHAQSKNKHYWQRNYKQQQTTDDTTLKIVLCGMTVN